MERKHAWTKKVILKIRRRKWWKNGVYHILKLKYVNDILCLNDGINMLNGAKSDKIKLNQIPIKKNLTLQNQFLLHIYMSQQQCFIYDNGNFKIQTWN